MKANVGKRTAAGCLAFSCAFVLAAPMFGETRSAMTGIGVRVERHTGVVIAPPASPRPADSDSRGEAGRVTASGNGAALVMLWADPAHAGARHPGSRTEVTIFEP